MSFSEKLRMCQFLQKTSCSCFKEKWYEQNHKRQLMPVLSMFLNKSYKVSSSFRRVIDIHGYFLRKSSIIMTLINSWRPFSIFLSFSIPGINFPLALNMISILTNFP